MSAPIILSWSSGKDSAWALYTLQNDPDFEVVGLVTTVNREHSRVAMHGVRKALLQQQADAAGLPLHTLDLPYPCSNDEYESIMQEFITSMQNNAIKHIAFGDLFLEDIRAYRETQLKDTGITPVFPLWQLPTAALAREMIDAGLETHLTCVDPAQLSPDFAGRHFDHGLLDELPAHIDPCGENGEFHTCVTAGPMFKHAINIKPGDIVERDNFVFADFIPT